MIKSKYGGFHSMTANVSIGTNLSENIKGIHMSRLILTLKPYLELPLNHILIKQILFDLLNNLETENSFIKFEFELPIRKKSIVSNNEFPIFYKCVFKGNLIKHIREEELEYPGSCKEPYYYEFKFFEGVEIQYSSYCPCSAELCKNLNEKGEFGFPHAQRSFANVLIEVKEENLIWLEDIIELVENAVVTLPYPIIKREDEKLIAKFAYENTQFVEDAIRKIANSLNFKKEIYDWIIKVYHEESIHTNNAIALCWKGIEDGLNEKNL